MNVITVVGRAKNLQQFLVETTQLLYGGFTIVSWYSLGEPGVDLKDRFLLMISASGETEFEFEVQAQRLESPDVSVKLHETPEDALEYANENYNLPDEVLHKHETLDQLLDEFPNMTASEIEKFSVFDALMTANRVSTIPAKIFGERTVAIVSLVRGPDEIRLTPLALLVTDEIAEHLELPGEE